MPLRSSSERRRLVAKQKFRGTVIIMPFYANYISLGCFYRVLKQVKKCEKCYKHNR